MSATRFDLAARMPDEGDILAGVVANLADDTPKLVYADWLDEHHDPRGDFLRRYVAAAASGADLPAPEGMPAGWLEAVGYVLEGRIRAENLVAHREVVRGLARPAVAIETELTEESDIRLGGSKLGGLPHLPPAAGWPRCDGGPLAFHAQFDLADLARTVAGRRLPAAGLLSLFMYHDLRRGVYGEQEYGRGCAGGLQVIYTPPGVHVEPMSPPAEMDVNSGAPRAPLRLTLSDALDGPRRPSGYPYLRQAPEGFPVEIYEADLQSPRAAAAAAQLFGHAHPSYVDGDPRPGDDWELLVRLASDGGWVGWGDEHDLFWYIRTDDLAARRFDRTVAIDG